MTHNHGDPLYPQAIMESPELLAWFVRAEVRPATRYERLRLFAWRVIRAVRP